MKEIYSFEDALQKSLEWCENQTGWKRMCDIEDTDSLYKTWEELPKRVREEWEKHCGEQNAKSAWEEFGEKPCKIPYGFVSGKGEFFRRILDVPLHHNLMTVYKVG